MSVKIRIFVSALCLVLSSWLLVSCFGKAGCTFPAATPNMLVQFVTVQINESTGLEETVPYTLTDYLTVIGVGVDVPLIENQQNVKQLNLPLNIAVNETTYILTISTDETIQPVTETVDEINTTYQLQREFLSAECGFYETFYDLAVSITQNRIVKSVQLSNTITLENASNPVLYIYF